MVNFSSSGSDTFPSGMVVSHHTISVSTWTLTGTWSDGVQDAVVFGTRAGTSAITSGNKMVIMVNFESTAAASYDASDHARWRVTGDGISGFLMINENYYYGFNHYVTMSIGFQYTVTTTTATPTWNFEAVRAGGDASYEFESFQWNFFEIE